MWYVIFGVIEVIIILFYVFCSEYDDQVNPEGSLANNGAVENLLRSGYTVFQDIHVMIFVGFGFLMTFLKSGSWSAVSFNFMISAFCIQFGMLVIHFWDNVFKDDEEGKGWTKVHLNLEYLVEGDFAAATVLVAFGAVLGKIGPIQLVVMAILQIIFYGLNIKIGLLSLKTFDIGGSMYIHMFGALFGCAVSKVISKMDKIEKNPKMGSSYNSNLFAFIGTLFLWMYWPSFNGFFSSGNQKHRVIVNSVLSLTGSCLAVFISTPLVHEEGKFNMESVLNATLAGGVGIGGTADIITNGWGAILVGASAGLISIIFYEKLTKVFLSKHWLYDTCGVLNLHGVPGILGGLIGAVAAWGSNSETYALSVGADPEDISSGSQGGKQLLALLMTFGISIGGGVITGFVLKALPENTNYFDDHAYWDMQEQDSEHQRLGTVHTEREMEEKKEENKEQEA